ncbi:MAG: AMP-binding protein [Bacteroidota bacterium]
MTLKLSDLLQTLDHQPDPALPPAVIALIHETLVEGSGTAVSDAELRAFLQAAASPQFLQSLSREQRYGPLERCVRAALLRSGYSLHDLLRDRERTLSGRCFLQEGDGERRSLSFAQTRLRCAAIAHALLADPRTSDSRPPRVALFTNNSLESALCDLACLSYGIFITPLSVHLDEQSIGEIFRRLSITVVLADDEDRLRRLLRVRREQALDFAVLAVGNIDSGEKEIERFESYVATNRERELPGGSIAAARRNPIGYTTAATVMFTSGSTGRPKGVCFSMMNMISKRFSRAAALPDVGMDETLVAFLPLFHTFGRFLELQGMLFWGGKYVFAGNPSREALFARMREFRPTGLISIPQRWTELHKEVESSMAAQRTGSSGEEGRNGSVKQTDAAQSVLAAAGGRLRWGLSAAGYLAPAVFRFFHDHGVALCSGFGMTEATGGILMTPPGEYQDDSVGIPLPGIEVRQTEVGELEMRGPYVALPLPEDADAPLPQQDGSEYSWQSTGDLFEQEPGGHYRIIDRVKDIYKNSRGQTIAPMGVESRFREVPGLKQCFLAGDGRSHNVLLIIADEASPAMRSMPVAQQRQSYFNEIVRAVNRELPVYERILEFTVLKRDFSQSEGELTSKGSFNRKLIAENFREEIDQLYRARRLSFRIAGLQLHLPLWMLRDIGCTERDIRVHPEGLYNAAEQRLLAVSQGRDGMSWRIGDIEYQLADDGIDLGRLCRQPFGWVGNQALADFFPCHEGWDVRLDDVLAVRPLRSQYHDGANSSWSQTSASTEAQRKDEGNRGSIGSQLLQLHGMLAVVFAAESPAALQLFDDLAAALQFIPHRHAALLRQRLGSCGWHEVDAVRIRAYSTLMLFDPDPEDASPYNAFMESGKTFLDDFALERIATLDLRGEQLTALRRRMHAYRKHSPAPSPEEQRVYRHLLELLYRLASRDASFVYEVRAEFAQWMSVTGMQEHARKLFYDLKGVYAKRQTALVQDEKALRLVVGNALEFDEKVSSAHREQIITLFSATPFLSLTLLMLHGVDGLRCDKLAERSVSVEALTPRPGNSQQFRVLLKTNSGLRYTFLLLLDERFALPEQQQTLLALLRIAGAPVRLPALPRFGSFMPEFGAISLGEAPGRQLAELMEKRRMDADAAELRRWWISGLSAWIRGWRDSGRLLIPGAIDAENVIVPWIRYREGAVILSVAGWISCEGEHCIVSALFDVLRRAAVRWQDARLQPSWVCDAVFEVLGDAEARALLLGLISSQGQPTAGIAAQLSETGSGEAGIEVQNGGSGEPDGLPVDVIVSSIQLRERQYCPPLAVQNAVSGWREWAAVYPQLVDERGEGYLRHVLDLYGVRREGEAARWYATRHTVLAGLPPDCGARLEELILRMHNNSSWIVTRSVELAELQERVPPGLSRERFLAMVFPDGGGKEMQLVRLRQGGQESVMLEHAVHESAHDDCIIREAVSAAETGVILSLLVRERFPVPLGEELRYLALLDARRRIIGGLVYAAPQDGEAELKAIVVEEALRGHGFGRALIDDLSLRMKTAGARSLRAPHYLLPFCANSGFTPDLRDGELRRFFAEAAQSE